MAERGRAGPMTGAHKTVAIVDENMGLGALSSFGTTPVRKPLNGLMGRSGAMCTGIYVCSIIRDVKYNECDLKKFLFF